MIHIPAKEMDKNLSLQANGLLASETQVFSTLLSSTEFLYSSSFWAPPSHLSRTPVLSPACIKVSNGVRVLVNVPLFRYLGLVGDSVALGAG